MSASRRRSSSCSATSSGTSGCRCCSSRTTCRWCGRSRSAWPSCTRVPSPSLARSARCWAPPVSRTPASSSPTPRHWRPRPPRSASASRRPTPRPQADRASAPTARPARHHGRPACAVGAAVSRQPGHAGAGDVVARRVRRGVRRRVHREPAVRTGPGVAADRPAAVAHPAHVPTFAHCLRNAGYRTVLAGKMHFCGPDQLHGFEERLTTDIYPADFGWTPDWDHPDDRPSWYHDMSSVTDAGPCLRSNQLDYDDEVAFAAERSLFGHVRSRDERPFCYVISFAHPHDPFVILRAWWDLYRDADIPMPHAGPAGAGLHPHERRLRAVCAMDGMRITDDQVRAARRAYYGAVSYVDDRISRLLTVLRDTGRLDNTVVVVTSDHGEMLGERGAWYKMSCYEGAARVPLIVWSPGLFPA